MRKRKIEKVKDNATDGEEIVVLPRKKPIVVDLDPDDLRDYIDNRIESLQHEQVVTDIDRNIGKYIDIKIEEKTTLKQKNEKSAKEAREEAKRRQMKAGMNSKKMMCECCSNGDHNNLTNLTFNTKT